MEKRPAKHCHLCGRRLWGGGWVYACDGVVGDGAQRQALVVCRRCHRTAPRCDSCEAPMGGNHVALPDGRLICARCHQTAIYDRERAQQLFERVSDLIVRRLGLALNVGADFTLVDHQHLQRLALEASHDLIGDAAHLAGLFQRKGRRRMMYLLSGLPQLLFVQVVAHEWAHAWAGENCPLLREPLVREGFAEWVAYKTLHLLGAVKKTVAMARRRGLYGDGLRKMLALERDVGASGVLDFCRRAA